MRRVALALFLTGCTKSQIVDFAMSSAPHHASSNIRIGGYQLLAGDMHCHVQPPDAPYHVSRGFSETLRLAERENLDFVVLTPHVNSRFFLDADARAWVQRTQHDIRNRIVALSTHSEIPTDVLIIPGMEYTDYLHGHIGLGFANIDTVLAAVSVDEANAHPERFFQAWQAEGGTITINHPFLTGLPKAPIAELHYDLSWRPDDPRFPELKYLSDHADAVETWNESIGHVRDRYFIGDPAWELRQATHLVESEGKSRAQSGRRIAPVGGSDSHGSWLRPTTWVLATARTPEAIRDAIEHGRTCVRAAAACTFEARTTGDWAQVGASLATDPEHTVELRARGDARYFVNGVMLEDGVSTIHTDRRCTTIHAVINDGVSAPIYVDCPSITGPPLLKAL